VNWSTLCATLPRRADVSVGRGGNRLRNDICHASLCKPRGNMRQPRTLRLVSAVLHIRKRRRRSEENENGCDIGYALVASPCEGANNVDACTVTAYDGITTFALQQCQLSPTWPGSDRTYQRFPYKTGRRLSCRRRSSVYARRGRGESRLDLRASRRIRPYRDRHL